MQLIRDVTISVYNFAYKKNLAVSLEQSYRDALVFPLLKACLNIISNDKMLFIPGEVPLESMTCQLENLKKALAPNEKYYADGMVKYLDNDICIYETSGPFSSKEKSSKALIFIKFFLVFHPALLQCSIL
ncbi:hypothetical protein BDF21DRAFT_450819 [Thamnidium elegans]|nr:hypothetical protein BDF21DRAFT_450819 [Thamnidium elegans]